MTKTILVTGGAGFIGSNFVRHLHAKYPDYRILVLDALTYAGSLDNLPLDPKSGSSDRVLFWYGNVCNAAAVGAVAAESDIIVHMAAETHVTRSIYDNSTFFETDVLGSQIVANAVLACRDRVKLLIHVSSSEVYGSAESERMSEDHPLNPCSPYAAAKAGADRLMYSYWSTYRLPVVIVRPFNQYGPSQHLEKVVPRFITSCILGEPLRVHGDGGAGRDWTFVGDLVRALDLVLHADREAVVGQVINVGSGDCRSTREVAEKIVQTMGCPRSLIQYIGDRPGQVFRQRAANEKAAGLLGWRPEVGWEEGLERTIRWYRDNRPWWERRMYMREVPIITGTGKRELH